MEWQLRKRRYLILFIVPCILTIIFAFLYFNSKHKYDLLNREYKETTDFIQAGKDRLAAKVDSLETIVADLQKTRTANALDLQNLPIEWMRKKGFIDPVNNVIADLQKHPELIPIEGTLGGRMGFYYKQRIWILTHNWVLACFDDGHIGGQMLLEYSVTDDGKIQWKPIAVKAD